MNRVERRARAEARRESYRDAIWSAMAKATDNVKPNERGNFPLKTICQAGDREIVRLAGEHPQDKAVVLQAGYQVRDAFGEAIEAVKAETKREEEEAKEA